MAPAKHVGQLCKRCNEREADLTVRSDPLCRTCFCRYAQTKIVKRVETFPTRTRNLGDGQSRKFLLPLSLGVSSLAVLNVLHQHLKAQQAKSRRVGYALHVVHIVNDLTEDTDEASSLLSVIEKRFPGPEYARVPLSSVFESSLSFAPTASSGQSIDGLHERRDTPSGEYLSQLTTLLEAVTSPTARADVLSLLQTRLLVRIAQVHACEGILWGDSTTKLAEKVLGETSKGRGFSLAWQVSDGESPYGPAFYYPNRDLLKKEIIAWAGFTEPPLTDLVKADEFTPTLAPPSSKSTTIDAMMKQYFESVEESYPSIVSNVVRTSSRLQISSMQSLDRCRLCYLPITDDQKGIHGWGGDQAESSQSLTERGQLCYGCARSVPPEAVPLLPPL